jgi:hypothetical protein
MKHSIEHTRLELIETKYELIKLKDCKPDFKKMELELTEEFKKITDKISITFNKNPSEIELLYKALQLKLDQKTEEHQKLVMKHNSTLKTHQYVKFKEKGACFYIIEQGIPCTCSVSRKKFGVAGIGKGKDNHDTIDDRLRSHRTIWPQLKVNYILFVKEAEVIEQSIKRIYEKEINPNGHEIIVGVTTEQLVDTITTILHALGITQFTLAEESKRNAYNEYVTTTVK